MTRAQIAALAMEGPERAAETPRERRAWWRGLQYGLVLGLAVGAVGTVWALARVVERAAGVGP